MQHIISIANHKGGVGKTTSVHNLGAGLARRGKRTLLIDLDPQANLSDSFGYRDVEPSIFEAMLEQSEPPIIRISEALHLIPAHLGLSGAEVYFGNEVAREKILETRVLNKVKEGYDYILIDCPPSLGLLTVNAFSASNEILIPLDGEYFSMRGLENLNELIIRVQKAINPGLAITGVFFNKFDPRMVIKNNVEAIVREQYGDRVFKTYIRSNIALAEAQAQGVDVFQYAGGSNGAQDYEALVEELLGVGQPKKAITVK